MHRQSGYPALQDNRFGDRQQLTPAQGSVHPLARLRHKGGVDFRAFVTQEQEAVLYVIPGMRQTWPPAKVNANERIWSFFLRYARR